MMHVCACDTPGTPAQEAERMRVYRAITERVDEGMSQVELNARRKWGLQQDPVHISKEATSSKTV